MKIPKQTFLHNELWLLIYGGAFQRANVYKADVSAGKRAKFRAAVKSFVQEHILPQYETTVCEMAHILNIESIIVLSKKWHKILNNEKLTFGVSQKILNLALKYYWCLGEIVEPPHCPVDRIIQKKGLKIKNVTNWTTLDNKGDYLRIIHQIENIAKKEGKSIAEWELETFER